MGGFVEHSVTCFLKAGIYVLVCGPSHGTDGPEDLISVIFSVPQRAFPTLLCER